MAAQRLRMKQLRNILRLRHELGLSHRQIVRSTGIGLGTVSEYLARAKGAGLSWPLPDDLDDTALPRLQASDEPLYGVVPVREAVQLHQVLIEFVNFPDFC